MDIAEGIIYRWYKQSEGKKEKVTEKVGEQDKEIIGENTRAEKKPGEVYLST